MIGAFLNKIWKGNNEYYQTLNALDDLGLQIVPENFPFLKSPNFNDDMGVPEEIKKVITILLSITLNERLTFTKYIPNIELLKEKLTLNNLSKECNSNRLTSFLINHNKYYDFESYLIHTRI